MLRLLTQIMAGFITSELAALVVDFFISGNVTELFSELNKLIKSRETSIFVCMCFVTNYLDLITASIHHHHHHELNILKIF